MKTKTPESDPLFALKYIAYCRTGLPVNEDDVDDEALLAFAKWQICKVRNKLWNDPLWDTYTPQELLVEYFAIKFDESADLRKEFERGLVTAKKEDIDWMFAMEQRHLAEVRSSEGIITEDNSAKADTKPSFTVPAEFEETY